jgi:hypothetical protein
MGLLGFKQRRNLHSAHLEEKIVDGRKCFVAGGPDKGKVEEPNLVLASSDRVSSMLKLVCSFCSAKLA